MTLRSSWRGRAVVAAQHAKRLNPERLPNQKNAKRHRSGRIWAALREGHDVPKDWSSHRDTSTVDDRPLPDRLHRILRLRLKCLERRSRLRRSLRILEIRLETLTKMAAAEAATTT
jgi:hypothetical protein